jgi:hypothetical protein
MSTHKLPPKYQVLLLIVYESYPDSYTVEGRNREENQEIRFKIP